MNDEVTEDSPMTDRDLAQLLQARAEQLAAGEITRGDALVDAVRLAARETDEVVTDTGAIGTRGRVSFGRANAGRHGTAVFLPHGDDVDVVDETEA